MVPAGGCLGPLQNECQTSSTGETLFPPKTPQTPTCAMRAHVRAPPHRTPLPLPRCVQYVELAWRSTQAQWVDHESAAAEDVPGYGGSRPLIRGLKLRSPRAR